MAGIDRVAVEAVARLARLRFDPAQLEQMASELERIVDYVAVLEELPDQSSGTDGDATNPTPLRDDRVLNEARPAAMLAGAPDRKGDLIRVPSVILKDS